MPSDLHDALAEGLCAEYRGKPSISVLQQHILGANSDTRMGVFFTLRALQRETFSVEVRSI